MENAMKIAMNEMAYYENGHWPFYQPSSDWGKLMRLFWGYRIVRRMMGGTWVYGPEFGVWLKTNEHYPKEWVTKHKHEIWA